MTRKAWSPRRICRATPGVRMRIARAAAPSRQKGKAAALNRPFLVPGGVGGSTPELRSGDPGPSPGRGTKLLKVMGPPLLAQRRTRITNPGIGP